MHAPDESSNKLILNVCVPIPNNQIGLSNAWAHLVGRALTDKNLGHFSEYARLENSQVFEHI